MTFPFFIWPLLDFLEEEGFQTISTNLFNLGRSSFQSVYLFSLLVFILFALIRLLFQFLFNLARIKNPLIYLFVPKIIILFSITLLILRWFERIHNLQIILRRQRDVKCVDFLQSINILKIIGEEFLSCTQMTHKLRVFIYKSLRPFALIINYFLWLLRSYQLLTC